MFSIDEINELALGQLSRNELERALEAFNGFAALFNKDWVTGYFVGGVESHSKSAAGRKIGRTMARGH
jgi:hypothetical protein